MSSVKRSLSHFAIYAAAIVVFLMAFTANAMAQAVVAAPASPDDATAYQLIRAVYDAFAGGHHVAAGALALVAAIALLKRYASKLPKIGAPIDAFLHTDVGGAFATLGLSFFGAIAAATANASLSWSVITTSGGIAVAAVGGYTLIKKLVIDRLEASAWYKASAPAWLKFIVSLIDPPSAIAVAEKAGADAVAAAPSPGASGIAGPATKF